MNKAINYSINFTYEPWRRSKKEYVPNLVYYDAYFSTSTLKNEALEYALVLHLRCQNKDLYYYGARYYAAWICRFVSVDPLQHDYPYYTPYQYAGNKPITYIDLDGLEEKPVVTDENKRLETLESLMGIKVDSKLETSMSFGTFEQVSSTIDPNATNHFSSSQKEQALPSKDLIEFMYKASAQIGAINNMAVTGAESFDNKFIMSSQGELFLKNNDLHFKVSSKKVLRGGDVMKSKNNRSYVSLTDDLGSITKAASNFGTALDVFTVGYDITKVFDEKEEVQKEGKRNLANKTISIILTRTINPLASGIYEFGVLVSEDPRTHEELMRKYAREMEEYRYTDNVKFDIAERNYKKYKELLGIPNQPKQEQTFNQN
jgi:RHS repeat-associated protein